MDKARQETDKRLAEMEKHLAGIYERANREVGEKWKAYMEEAAKTVKPLEKAVEAAKKSGDAEAIKKAEKALAAKQKEITILDTHYRNLTKQTAAELSNVNKTAVAYINDQIPKIYEINYNGIGKDVENAVKGYSFELVDAHTVKELVTKDNSLLPQPKINIAKDVRWNTQTINSEVLQGIIQGESMPSIAKRFRNVTTMNRASALRNARTAVTGAENRGRLDMLRNAKDKGINANKVWMATGDNRTRDAHAELDGEEAKIEEPFVNEFGEIMFPGDPGADAANVYNCRCTLTYNILGFGASEDAVNIEGNLIQYSEKLDDERWNGSKSIINGLAAEYDTKLIEVRAGSHASAGSVQISGTVMHLSSTAPDVAIHEFAHTISLEAQTKVGLYDDSAFWKEIKKVQREYKRNVRDDTKRWISSYEHSSKGADEFMAEAFTQAKAMEMGISLPKKYGSDLTYSRQVLEIIDKYFKKK